MYHVMWNQLIYVRRNVYVLSVSHAMCHVMCYLLVYVAGNVLCGT